MNNLTISGEHETLAAVRELLPELIRAQGHPAYHSYHEAFGVIAEEVDEFWEIVKQKSSERDPLAARSELLQIAACCIKAVVSLMPETLPKPREPKVEFEPEMVRVKLPLPSNPAAPVLPISGAYPHVVRAHMLPPEKLAEINIASDIVLTYKNDEDAFEVRAWTNELDENSGNVKGYIRFGSFRKAFGEFLAHKSYRDGTVQRIDRGALVKGREPVYAAEDLSQNHLSVDHVKWLNTLSPVTFTYSGGKEAKFIVRACTNMIDSSQGNVKGYIYEGAARRAFPKSLPANRWYNEGDSTKVARGYLE